MTAFDVTGEELKEIKIQKFLNKPIYLKKLLDIVKMSLIEQSNYFLTSVNYLRRFKF